MKKKPSKVTRIPRPTGITLANKKQENREELINQLLNQYVNNGYRLNNKLVSIPELSQYLNVSEHELLRKITKHTDRIANLLSGSDGLNLARVAKKMALQNSLNAATEATTQLQVLKASQGGQYVAFTSAEVNKAVANNVAAAKMLNDVADSFMNTLRPTGSGTNIHINNTNEASVGHKFLTAETASKYLDEKAQQTALTEPKILYQSIPEEALKGLPEVRANHQDLRGIGIKYDGTQAEIKASDEARKLKDNGTQEANHHNMRRQGNENILDMDDLVEDEI